MHPVLVKIGFLPIHSYGLMLAVSFLVGMLISARRGAKAGIDRNAIMDLAFWIILSAILGARLYYVLLHPEDFRGHWLDVINPFGGGQVGIGGLVMYGGLFGAILAGTFFMRLRGMPVLKTCDAIAPAVGLGIAITRIGCFLNGCCYGTRTMEPWGISFPPESPAGYFQHMMGYLHIHPSQLYESAGGLVIFGLILLSERWKRFEGHSVFLLLMLYPILRFAVDFTRYYGKDEMIRGLSHNQVFCILLFVAAGSAWVALRLKAEKAMQPVMPTSSEPQAQS